MTDPPQEDRVLGDGRRKLPMRTDVRTVIGKQAGDEVTVQVDERL